MINHVTWRNVRGQSCAIHVLIGRRIEEKSVYIASDFRSSCWALKSTQKRSQEACHFTPVVFGKRVLDQLCSALSSTREFKNVFTFCFNFNSLFFEILFIIQLFISMWCKPSISATMFYILTKRVTKLRLFSDRFSNFYLCSDYNVSNFAVPLNLRELKLLSPKIILAKSGRWKSLVFCGHTKDKTSLCYSAPEFLSYEYSVCLKRTALAYCGRENCAAQKKISWTSNWLFRRYSVYKCFCFNHTLHLFCFKSLPLWL